MSMQGAYLWPFNFISCCIVVIIPEKDLISDFKNKNFIVLQLIIFLSF